MYVMEKDQMSKRICFYICMHMKHATQTLHLNSLLFFLLLLDLLGLCIYIVVYAQCPKRQSSHVLRQKPMWSFAQRSVFFFSLFSLSNKLKIYYSQRRNGTYADNNACKCGFLFLLLARIKPRTRNQ